MKSFSATFEIVNVRNCPFHIPGESFLLTDKAVELPLGRSACLILVRELTGLLFTFLSKEAHEFEALRDTLYTCGGCTGLIKFKLADKPAADATGQAQAHLKKQAGSVVSGQIEAITPAELLQVFHMHQKTGRLLFEFEKGTARVTFREGGLLAARYEDFDNQEAIYAVLTQKKGTFHFVPGLPDALMKTRELGDFMMILMEGLRRLDESEHASPAYTGKPIS